MCLKNQGSNVEGQLVGVHLETSASIKASIWVLAALLLPMLPTNAPGEAADHGPSVWPSRSRWETRMEFYSWTFSQPGLLQQFRKQARGWKMSVCLPSITLSFKQLQKVIKKCKLGTTHFASDRLCFGGWVKGLLHHSWQFLSDGNFNR